MRTRGSIQPGVRGGRVGAAADGLASGAKQEARAAAAAAMAAVALAPLAAARVWQWGVAAGKDER